MPRERLRPGEHGRITETSSGGRFYAATYIRDADGKRRRVERSSSRSAEDARRLLQRHLGQRRAPAAGRDVTDRTSLSELFELWITAKESVDNVRPQTVDTYRMVWRNHGADRLGALRISELSTSRAHNYLQSIRSRSQANRLRMILVDMFTMAARFDVISVNPMREVRTSGTVRKPARALTVAELRRVRAAVSNYAHRPGRGPRRGRLLPAFVEVLYATGCRPNEVLALRWSDVDLLGDPPTVTVVGTLIDYGRVAGKALHRQDARKGDAPAHTVVLPRFGVEALAALIGESGIDGPVFANRGGGWISLTNMRRSLRSALPADLQWVTPHSFRRTVATVVRDAHGPASAQQQLSHSTLATTESHYLQRSTRGPDVREALEKYGDRG
jgi:integrase